MKTNVVVFAVSLLFCCSAPAAVDIADGNSLLRACETAVKPQKSGDESVQALALMAYVDGFEDATIFSAALHQSGPPFGSDGVTVEQKVRVIKKWLEEHPKELHKPAAALIYLSLRDAFPPLSR